MNYSDLKGHVASFMDRDDLTTQIITFIELAEAFLFRELHIKEMEISVDGTTTDNYADLPADFSSVSRLAVPWGNTTRSLDYVALAEAPEASIYPPTKYSLENNKLRIWGASDGQVYTLFYIPKILNLSDTDTTNWLLTNAPELYIDAACLQGAKFLKDDAAIGLLTSNVTASLDSVKRFSERRGHPATGSMQIKVRRG